MIYNYNFLNKAKALTPKLITGRAEARPADYKVYKGQNGVFELDFGHHLVGYVTLYFDVKRGNDNSPDAPLEAVLKFGEIPEETEEFSYTGGLSSSWIQRETVHIDNPLKPYKLPRRYAFRYLKITLTANTSYNVALKKCVVKTVTSADVGILEPVKTEDAQLKAIDNVSCNTLRDCMQLVFEDGPKRDRRLWLGDLYLQAKANYYTFKNYDLVRRCLYLFAGLTHDNGCLSSAVFHEPMLHIQDWVIHDYALFFIGTLADFYRETGDIGLVKELWKTAYRQAEIASEALDEEGFVNTDNYFVDWCGPLDKLPAAQGTYVAMLREAKFLAVLAGNSEEINRIQRLIDRGSSALMKLYNAEKSLFIGKNGQLSVQSQMWGVLAGVLDCETGRRTLEAIEREPDAVKTVTPYAMHYYAEAMFQCGMREEATAKIREYWGEMVMRGADTFWEVFVPENPKASPYDQPLINSYCHAWSCTPAYFIRKYLQKG